MRTHPRRLSPDDEELISWAKNLREPEPTPVRTPVPARPDLLTHLERSGDDPQHFVAGTSWLLFHAAHEALTGAHQRLAGNPMTAEEIAPAPHDCPCCGDPHTYGPGELCDYCWHSGDHDNDEEPEQPPRRPVVTADIAGGVL